MQRAHEWRVLRVAVIASDAVAIALAFALAWALTHDVHASGGAPAALTLRHVIRIGAYTAGWMLLLAAYHLYDSESLLDGFAQYERIAQASTTGLLLLVGILAVLDGEALIPRSLLLVSWLLSVVVLASSRFVMRRIVWRLRRHGYFRARMLIVGAGEDGVAVAEQIGSYASGAAEVVGFLDEYAAVGTRVSGCYEVLGEPMDLMRAVRRTAATDAILVPQAMSWEALQVLLQGEPASWGLRHVWLAPALRDLLTTGMEVHRRGSLPLLSVTGLRIGGLEGALKRAFDIIVTLLLLPVVVPVCAAIALWLAGVRHCRPLLRTPIIGDGRRRFMLYTFVPDPLLRRLHVWRLPALLNVLRGNMSLVGPRPMRSALESQYRTWQAMLVCVRPGLTGPWWLLSGTARLSIVAEVAVDLAYIRQYSIWADMHIFALTLRSLCSKRRRAGHEPETLAQPAEMASSAGATTP
ncbi:MAG: sugar transferase [Ktedonobacterales bacterium]